MTYSTATMSLIKRVLVLAAYLLIASACNTDLSVDTREVYQIRGVGVASECVFESPYDLLFPCGDWRGVSDSPTPILEVMLDTSPTDLVLVLGIASSEPLRSVTGEGVGRAWIDGTLAILALDTALSEEVSLSITSLSGETIDCVVDTSNVFGDAYSSPLRCSSWE